MSTLHICNTNFERELGQKNPPPLAHAFDQHEVFLQLQFLPFLYAPPEDGVLVTDIPEPNFWEKLEALQIKPPKLHHISSSSFSAYTQIQSWGYSLKIREWAEKNRIPYSMPDWQMIKRVNSKLFSFEQCPLPGAALLYNEEDLKQWLKNGKREAVLKTLFGSSGRGHYLIKNGEEIDFAKLLSFAAPEWKENRAILIEPWMHRILDFSTQWIVTKEIEQLGLTYCENDAKGRYKSNEVGDLTPFFQNYKEKLHEHDHFAQKVLSKIADVGYFGNVGIDAMIYEKEDRSIHLHPIVEINARKTMGWAALEIQKRHFPKKQLRLSFVKPEENKASFLPSFAKRQDGSKVPFSRQLQLLVRS